MLTKHSYYILKDIQKYGHSQTGLNSLYFYGLICL